jgi:hypothetical protein
MFIIEDRFTTDSCERFWAVSPDMQSPELLISTNATSIYKCLYMNSSIVVLVDQRNELQVRLQNKIKDAPIALQLEGREVTSLSISACSLDTNSEKHTLTYITSDLTLHQDELLITDGSIELLQKHSCQFIPSSLQSFFTFTKLIELSRDDSAIHFMAIGNKEGGKLSVFIFSTSKNDISIQSKIRKEISFNRSIISPTDQHFIFLVRRREPTQQDPHSVFVTFLSANPQRLLTMVVEQQGDDSWLIKKIKEASFDEVIDVKQTDLLAALFDEIDSGYLPFIKKDCPYLHYIATDTIYSAMANN